MIAFALLPLARAWQIGGGAQGVCLDSGQLRPRVGKARVADFRTKGTRRHGDNIALDPDHTWPPLFSVMLIAAAGNTAMQSILPAISAKLHPDIWVSLAFSVGGAAVV